MSNWLLNTSLEMIIFKIKNFYFLNIHDQTFGMPKYLFNCLNLNIVLFINWQDKTTKYLFTKKFTQINWNSIYSEN